MDTVDMKKEIDSTDLDDEVARTNGFIFSEIMIKDENISDFEDETCEKIDDNNGYDMSTKNATKQHRTNNCNQASEGEFTKLFTQLVNNEIEFVKHFQMSYKKFNELLEIIRPFITKKNTTSRETISPEERLAVTLRYLTTGDSSRIIAAEYKLGISTVSQIIHSVVKAIANLLPAKVMQRPTEESWQSIEQTFHEKCSFPNCVGIIDGREFKLYLKSGKFSLLLLAVIDADSKFVIVNVGDYNKLSEGGFLNSSMLGKIINDDVLKLPPDKPITADKSVLPHFFIADNVFPLRNNVIRPYPKKLKRTEENKLFNEYILEALKPADEAFKMLINHYKVFQSKVLLKPEYMKNIILATCCLHNFLRDEREHNYGTIKEVTTYIKKLPGQGGMSGKHGKIVREHLKEYFISKGKLNNKDAP